MKPRPTKGERAMIEALASLPQDARGLATALGTISAWAYRISRDEQSTSPIILDLVDVLLASRAACEDDEVRRELASAVARLARSKRLVTLTDTDVTTKAFVAARLVEEIERYPCDTDATIEELAGMLVAWCHAPLVRLGFTTLTRAEARKVLATKLPRILMRAREAKTKDGEATAAACLRALGATPKQADNFIRGAKNAATRRGSSTQV